MSEKYNICLDVGGTKVLGAIFDENDKIIYRLKKPPAEPLPDEDPNNRNALRGWLHRFVK